MYPFLNIVLTKSKLTACKKKTIQDLNHSKKLHFGIQDSNQLFTFGEPRFKQIFWKFKIDNMSISRNRFTEA